MWGAPIGWHQHAPKGCFLFFERVRQLGGTSMPPRDVSYCFEELGAWFHIKFPNSSFNNLSKSICSHQVPNNSHQIPPVFINNPSKYFCSHQVPKKSLLFPSVIRQKPFVFIKFPSNSFCFHQVPIKFLLFPSSFYQNLFVPIIFPSTSHCPCQLHFVPNPTLHKHTQSSKLCERLGQSAKRSAAVPGQAGRGDSSGRQTSAARGRAESRDILPARSCGRSRVDLLLARHSAVLPPSCACAKRDRIWLGYSRGNCIWVYMGCPCGE
jgi:hypothetical protein